MQDDFSEMKYLIIILWDKKEWENGPGTKNRTHPEFHYHPFALPSI